MDKRKIGLSVVIPCFNEVENIVLLLKELKEIFLTSKYNIEVIIVDGCSTDDTHLFLKEEFRNLDKNIFSLILMENQNGYGNDILEGLKKARYEYLCWTHADLQTDPNDVIRGLEIIDSHAGNKKFIKGKRKSRPFFDLLLTYGMQLIVFLLLKVRLNDINAQPKIFHRSFYDKFLKDRSPKDFSLDLFALYEAKTNNYEIISFPVQFKKREFGVAKGGGGSLVNRWNLVKRTFRYIYRLKKDRLDSV
jgi:glycosyltransferase involved in cell wall biosynthesis